MGERGSGVEKAAAVGERILGDVDDAEDGGRSHGSAGAGFRRAGALQDRPDAFGIGKHVELFDPDPDPLDPRIGKAGRADPLGETLAQIDMAGPGDLADRGDDLLVIDDTAAVFAGKGGGAARSGRPTRAPAACARAPAGGCRCCTSARGRAR